MPPRLSVSDSEDSESENQRGGPPSDAQLERALRDTVAKVFRSGNLEDLTVKRVRAATEKALGLEEGFFKGHERWKAESDRIIRDEVVCFFYCTRQLLSRTLSCRPTGDSRSQAG